jgi:hypothetical protein
LKIYNIWAWSIKYGILFCIFFWKEGKSLALFHWVRRRVWTKSPFTTLLQKQLLSRHQVTHTFITRKNPKASLYFYILKEHCRMCVFVLENPSIPFIPNQIFTLCHRTPPRMKRGGNPCVEVKILNAEPLLEEPP